MLHIPTTRDAKAPLNRRQAAASGPTVHKMLYIAAYTCLFVYLSTEVLIEAICRVGKSGGSEPTVGIVQNAHKYKHTHACLHTQGDPLVENFPL